MSQLHPPAVPTATFLLTTMQQWAKPHLFSRDSACADYEAISNIIAIVGTA